MALRSDDQLKKNNPNNITKSDSNSLGSVILGKKRAPKVYKFGWGRLNPDCLQSLHNPKFLVFCMSVLLTAQGLVTSGLLPASVSHLERRFGLSSVQIGLMSSVNDVGFVIMLLPISICGNRGHKGRWLGLSALLTGAASFFCILPHFFAEEYKYGAVQPPQLCLNGTEGKSSSIKADYFGWVYMFFVAQFLFGMAASPLSNIAIAYLDENVAQEASSTYNSIYMGMNILGPCLGFAAGAVLARIYGDISADKSKIPMADHNDPRWYGAWWLGVMATGILSFLIAIPLFAFGRELPGKAALRAKDVDEAHHDGGKQAAGSMQLSVSLGGWIGFKQQSKAVLCNPTYIGLIIEQCATLFVVGGFATFTTKYLETQFSLSTSGASIAAALTGVPPIVLGILIGAVLQRRLGLKCRGNILLALIGTCIATASWIVFFFGCETRPFAGVNMFMSNPPVKHKYLIETKCHPDYECNCKLNRFEPICWPNQSVSFFSKCHAGCDESDFCWCIGGNATTLKDGLCDTACGPRDFMPFLIGFGVLVLFSSIKKNPVEQATLRCVPFNMRTFALAIGGFPRKILGALPATPVIGWMLSSNCLVWQLNKLDEREVCILYDNLAVAQELQLLGTVGFGTACMALVVSWFMYKPPPISEEEEKPSEQSLLEEVLRSSWNDQQPVFEP